MIDSTHPQKTFFALSLRLLVFPWQFRVPHAAFGENGKLVSKKDTAKLESVMERFLALAASQL